MWSGALATAGDVVFYGTMDGWFKAVDASDGAAAVAVQDRLGNHRPADHVSRSRRQAVHRGAVRRRRLGGAVVSGDLDTRDGSAAGGFGNVMGDLKQRTTKGGMLYVFALP